MNWSSGLFRSTGPSYLTLIGPFCPTLEWPFSPDPNNREYLRGEIAGLREGHPEMVYISFPGDEKSSGGCVAAGRGFFHINSHGGAEPCPFSPYSDVNIRKTSLRDAMHSPLFMALRDGDILVDDHDGGCVLYEKREIVEKLLTGMER